MSSKHTPGPWHVDWRGLVSIRDASGKVVISSPSGKTKTREENTANAMLAAAAPELLDAAEKALARIEIIEQFSTSDDEPMQDAAKFLRSAIAKAKGTSQ